MTTYQSEYQRSVSDVEGFWQEKALDLDWYKEPKSILSTDENGMQRWFADGELNTCYLALDYHVENGRAEQDALIYDSPVTGNKKTYRYRELRDAVALVAGGLKALGVGKGDTVIIYMPMIPEAVFAMLACARLGAIHSVVFGGFAANELAVRIDDAKPVAILSASCGVEPSKTIAYKPLLDDAIGMAQHKPAHSIVFQRPESLAVLNQARDIDWSEMVSSAAPAECEPVAATDPLYILYTSGTTGTPKGILRDNGGHAAAMKYSMNAIYDIQPGEVFWAASDVGWVVGHSYIVYAPLIHGCTTVLYEGKPIGTPDAGAFWRVVSEYNVKALFAAPTAFRAIKKQDADAALAKDYDLSCLETIFVAGERLDPPTYHWLNDKFQRPIIDHWWQTETGWAIAANMVGIERLPTKPGSSCVPTPGFNVEIIDDEGNALPVGEQGNIAVKLPLPPSCLPGIWNDFPRFKQYYLDPLPGYYLSGDGGYLDEEGYLFIMGRIDDVINIAGHRLSTGRMEEVVASHNAVAECAVVGVNDELKGQLPIGFVILKDGVDIEASVLEKELVALVRQEIGAIACFSRAFVVTRLPKTRSGKILRKVIRHIAHGEAYIVPSTIDDASSLDEFKDIFSEESC
ncbi:propionyl-CoA synthetase [Gammaproteobacteria bacterium 45_16_T64]|nr:propionyl-CoA synthetase [Gammaproteobacteria bacterium 45_16_T64]